MLGAMHSITHGFNPDKGTNMNNTTTNSTNNTWLTSEQQGQIIKMFWKYDGTNKLDHWDAMDVCNEYGVDFRNPDFYHELMYALMPKYEAGVDYGTGAKMTDDLAYIISRLMFNRMGHDETFMPGVITYTKVILMLSEILEAELSQSAASKQDIEFAIADILELEIEDIVKDYDLWTMSNAEKTEMTDKLLQRRATASTEVA